MSHFNDSAVNAVTVTTGVPLQHHLTIFFFTFTPIESFAYPYLHTSFLCFHYFMPITFPFLLLHPTLGSINPCPRSLLVSPLIHFPLPSSITIPMLLCLGCPFIRFLSLAHPMHHSSHACTYIHQTHRFIPTSTHTHGCSSSHIIQTRDACAQGQSLHSCHLFSLFIPPNPFFISHYPSH